METSICEEFVNIQDQNSDPTYEAWKPSSENWSLSFSFYSDPTYEAWKHKSSKKLRPASDNSDPTYEAWKPSFRIGRVSENLSYSDPTYEAWKLYFSTESFAESG